MTIWSPKLSAAAKNGPIYRRIVDLLEHDVEAGILVPGSRLPTQRELADRLGVTTVTITRAYQEAAARGLIDSTVGRGSYVRGNGSAPAPSPAVIDLATNIIHSAEEPALTKELFARIGDSLHAAYDTKCGTERHRAAGAKWMANVRPDAAAANVVVTAGAQHALLLALASLAKPGDTIVTEDVTYHGVRGAASLLHLKVEPVTTDRFGAVPEALERALRGKPGRVAYLTPTLQNPTGATMPEKRRREVSSIITRHAAMLIEDDVYGRLAEAPPPAISSLIPARSVFITSLSKSVLPALRVGFLLAPEDVLPRVQSALFATTLFTATPSAEIAATWIEDGTAARVAASKRAAIATRDALARRVIGKKTLAPSPHLWLPLPSKWNANDLTEAARSRGVKILPAANFATGNNPPNAIRISLGAPREVRELDAALRIIATLVARGESAVPQSIV